MKLISTHHPTDGIRRIVADLEEEESLMAIDLDGFYRLGDGRILSGHMIGDHQQVYWDPLEQQWKDVK